MKNGYRNARPGAWHDRRAVGGFAGHVLPQIKTFPGFIAHASGSVGGGHFVTEFWESRETYEKWLHEVIGPAMQQAGGGQPPQLHYHLSADVVITR